MRIVSALLVTIAMAAALPAKADPANIHALAMHGDAKYAPDFAHFDYVNPDAPKGGAVRLASIGGFDSLNPFIVKGEAAEGIGRIYDSLTEASADEPFSRYGLLAESMEMPGDRSWVAFNLRKEARWHDGRPVTSADVVFTFDTLLEKGRPFYRFYYANLDRVTAEGPSRVRFDFKPGENRELPLIIGEVPILPQHWWQDREFDRTSLDPPLGSGPYRVGAVDAGRSITYERVEDYWGAQLPVNRGRHNFGSIRYDYYRDGTVALEAFKAGAYDWRAENAAKDWATAYDVPALRDGSMKRLEVPHDRTAGMQGYAYNIRRELFQDPRVRHALAWAFDFEWSNRNLFHGQYARTRSFFDNSELAATGLPSPAELELLEPWRGQVPDEVFTAEYNPPSTDGTGQIRQNLREADNLLKAAGWVIEGGRRVHAETKRPFEFEVLLVSPLFERITLPFAGNLERLGIKVSIRTVDSAQYIRRLENYDFDMMVTVYGQSQSPGNEQRAYWNSDSADHAGGRNYIGVKSPAVDDLVEKVIAAPDRESLVTRVRALDRLLQWGHYVIPHWHLNYDRLAFWDKFGMPEVTPANGAQFDTWWIDPEKESASTSRRRN